MDLVLGIGTGVCTIRWFICPKSVRMHTVWSDMGIMNAREPHWWFWFYFFFFDVDFSHQDWNEYSLLKHTLYIDNVGNTNKNSGKKLSSIKQGLAYASSAMTAAHILGLIASKIALFISRVGLCFLFGLNPFTIGTHWPSAFKNELFRRESVGTPRALSHKTKIKTQTSNSGHYHHPHEHTHAQNMPLPPQEGWECKSNNLLSPN